MKGHRLTRLVEQLEAYALQQLACRIPHSRSEGFCVVFSESLAGRIRDVLYRHRGIAEKKMFGGIGFLLHGHMLIGVWKDSLIVRLGPTHGAAALQEPHVREFDVTGRPMKGWVMVDPEGVAEDHQLAKWIARAEQFVRTLPAK